MKTLFFIIALGFSTLMIGQKSEKTNSIVTEVNYKENSEVEMMNLSNLKIAVSLESLKELKEFNVDDLREIFKEMKPNEKIEFSLKYIYPENVNNVEMTRSFSYKLEGNSNKIDDLITSIIEIQKKAIRIASK